METSRDHPRGVYIISGGTLESSRALYVYVCGDKGESRSEAALESSRALYVYVCGDKGESRSEAAAGAVCGDKGDSRSEAAAGATAPERPATG